MKRRTFLQLSGMSAASSLLAGCRKGNEKLIPYLVPPEDGATPGIADYYASACRLCPAACGILVRVAGGRARKIEGNPRHPVNRGRLCARGQALLQEHYHPDRIKQPLKRSGPRGSGQFTPIDWEEGLQLLAERAAALQQQNRQQQLALLTPPLAGSQAALLGKFLRAYGGGQHLAWSPLAPDWRQQGLLTELGVPEYDIAETELLLSFGADLLENHLSPVAHANDFGRMRQARPTVRGRFTYIGPRLSMTAASADRWLPARPGTEWVFALGLARQLLQSGDYDRQSLRAAGLSEAEVGRYVAGFDSRQVAQLTGIGQADIKAALKEASRIRPAMAVVGEMATWQASGAAAVTAVDLLNLLLGSINRPGGLFFPTPFGERRTSGYTEVKALTSRMASGQVELALLQGGNPVYQLPPSSGFQAALARLPYLVSCSSFFDETARQADLILPEHSSLESWGDLRPQAPSRRPVISLMQPLVKPLYDSRAFPDLLLALAHSLGGETAAILPEGSYRQFLENHLATQLPELANGDRQQNFDRLLQQGGWFGPPESPQPLPKLSLPKRPALPAASDQQSEFPFQLQIYPSPAFADGSCSHLPWLQQLPDPMTTGVWGSWLEINPQTAARLGINQGDLVEISSTEGSLQLPALLYPGIRPEVLACPMGQGHQGLGRYADNRGVNPLQLLPAEEQQATLPAWGTGRVRLRRLAASAQLTTAGHPQGSYRQELLGL